MVTQKIGVLQYCDSSSLQKLSVSETLLLSGVVGLVDLLFVILVEVLPASGQVVDVWFLWGLIFH